MQYKQLKKIPWIKRWINRRFLSNISIVGISNILYAASQWGVLIIITKLTGIEDVARFSLSLAIVSPVMLFLGASLKVFISSDVLHRYALPVPDKTKHKK